MEGMGTEWKGRKRVSKMVRDVGAVAVRRLGVPGFRALIRLVDSDWVVDCWALDLDLDWIGVDSRSLIQSSISPRRFYFIFLFSFFISMFRGISSSFRGSRLKARRIDGGGDGDGDGEFLSLVAGKGGGVGKFNTIHIQIVAEVFECLGFLDLVGVRIEN